ncbi:hypothetical protein Tco_1110541 [Tanacetum coccineum]|uniref:Uncharacterized protein n=1 Tax=Tanacetum coccineum TaxID=301880 RepID=A0ABQ5IJ66_9ASTR
MFHLNHLFHLLFLKVPDTNDTIKFKLNSQEIVYTVDMFRSTLNLLVETTENPFIELATIKVIESFMQRVGYQGIVDKVSAFYTKFPAQPWQTMFKVFNRCLTTQTSGHDQTKINILQLFHVVVNRGHVDYAALLWWDFLNCVFQKKDVIQYPRFTKLIISDLMKKSPTLTTSSPQNKKRKQIAREISSPRKSLKVTIRQKKQSTTSIPPLVQEKLEEEEIEKMVEEPEGHKEHPKNVNDDDDETNKGRKDDEKANDDEKTDEMSSMETRKEKMQTLIPSPRN